MRKKADADNVAAVLRRLADWVEKEDAEIRGETADDVNGLLNEMLEADWFGTEGQNDPRGDQRG